MYEEGSLAKRSIRDLYTKDIDEIVVAGENGYKDAKEFMRMLMPSHAKNVKLYQDSQPVFTRYGIESQLDAMFSPTVQLRSGGYIVINQTEALVAIDVNSGRSTREHHIEDTALKTNVEASEEVARQLRLRDLAGLIVIDFIDMDEKRNNRTVERRLKDALRNDRARIQVGRISHFGLMEMSRQRIRTSVLESSTEKCPHCGGTGHVRSVSSVALQLLRSIEETLLKGPTHNLIVRTRPEIALYVLNHKRAHLRGLEERFQVTLTVNADEEVGGQIGFTIDRGEQVMTIEQAKALLAQAAAAAPALHRGRRAGLRRRGRRGERSRGRRAASAPSTPDRSTKSPKRRRSSADARRRRAARTATAARGGRGRSAGAGAAVAAAAAKAARAAHSRRVASTVRSSAARPRTISRASRQPTTASSRRRHGRRSKASRSRSRRAASRTATATATASLGAAGADGAADGATAATASRQRRFRRRRRATRRTSAPRLQRAAGLVAAARSRRRAGRRGADLRAARSSRPRAGTRSRSRAAAAAAARRREPPRRRSTVREPAPVFSGSAPVATPMPRTAAGPGRDQHGRR